MRRSEMADQNESALESAAAACWTHLWGNASSASDGFVAVASGTPQRRAQRIGKQKKTGIPPISQFWNAGHNTITGEMFDLGVIPHGGPMPSALPGPKTQKKQEMVLNARTMGDWAVVMSSMSENSKSLQGVGHLAVHIDEMNKADSVLSRGVLDMMSDIGISAKHLTLHGCHDSDFAEVVAKLYGDSASSITDLGWVLDKPDRGKKRLALPDIEKMREMAPKLAHFRFQDKSGKTIGQPTLDALAGYFSDSGISTISVSSHRMHAEKFEALAGETANRRRPLDYLHLSVIKQDRGSTNTDLSVFMSSADNVFLCCSARTFSVNKTCGWETRKNCACGVLVLPGAKEVDLVSEDTDTVRLSFEWRLRHARQKSSNVIVMKTYDSEGCDPTQVEESLLRSFEQHGGTPGGRFTLTSFNKTFSHSYS